MGWRVSWEAHNYARCERSLFGGRSKNLTLVHRVQVVPLSLTNRKWTSLALVTVELFKVGTVLVREVSGRATNEPGWQHRDSRRRRRRVKRRSRLLRCNRFRRACT